MLEINQIYNMDCVEGMKLLDDNSIDSIVTDPPYELGFMGKKWDSTGIAYNVDVWRECLRVLKPGGHLLAFGGTRTYHRMACAIEDAGFEIRDQIQWLYGSGFPKSMDISKAIDKAAGATREIVGTYETHDIRSNGLMDKKGSIEVDITAPSTPKARQWQGWGTALKPANEPICVARKPISEKTIAENVMKWGTGGLNIDGCRIGTEVRNNPQAGFIRRGRTDEEVFLGTDKNRPEGTVEVTGRFPANVILDEEAGKLLDEQTGILKSGSNCVRTKTGSFLEHGGLGKAGDVQVTYGDSGGASRFFYCAKASKKERGEGNTHPTVKPLSLIKYLITLVTPLNGICLDPFEGSGTHQRACIALGFNYIGFEIDKDYFKIIQSRADNVQIKMV